METGASERVDSIRQKARNNYQELRVRRRDLARDSRRLYLNDVAKSFKVPQGEEYRQLCHQLKKKKKLQVLQRIRLGLSSSSSDNINIFMSEPGFLYCLVGCLTGADAGLQREAACTLVNLALGTRDQCKEVCKKAGVYLVLLMSSANPDVQDPCGWCVGNLCGGHAEVCEMLRVQGVEEVMVGLLRSHSSHVLQSAAYAVLHYLTTLPHRVRPFFTKPVVQRLVQVTGGEGGSISEVCWCMFVASTDKEVCTLLVDQGIIPAAFTALERFLNEQNLNVGAATAVVRVVMNVTAVVPGTAVQVCYRGEQLVSVTKALLYCPHSHLRTETLHLLANVVNSASAESDTGERVVEDLCLRVRLEGALRSALAANFTAALPNSATFTADPHNRATFTADPHNTATFTADPHNSATFTADPHNTATFTADPHNTFSPAPSPL